MTSEMRTRGLPPLSLLRRLFRGGTPDEIHTFQVIVQYEPVHRLSEDELESHVGRAVEALVRDTGRTVLGPVAGFDLEKNALEIEFTIEVASPDDLYDKLGKVPRLLSDAGFVFLGSTEARLDPAESRELQPA